MIKTFCTMLAGGLTIIWTDAVVAQWVDRESMTRLINGASITRLAAGATHGGMVAVTDAKASALAGAANNGTPPKNALVGSWLETVTFPPESGRPQLKSLVTFHGDGTMINSDQGSVTADPPLVFTSGHSVWAQLEKRTFALTQLELISDLSGNLVGYLKVRGVYTIAQSGDEYNGNSFAEVFDTTGNVLFSVDVTNAGQRIQLELP